MATDPDSSLPPDARVRRLIAQAAEFIALGRLADAERQVQGALAFAPNDVDALRLNATLLRQRGRHAEAIAATRRALAQRPDDPQLLNSLGIGLQATGDLGGAVDAFRRAADLAPGNAAAQANLGKALVDSGDADEGAAALQTALDLEPHLAQPRFTLAYAHRIRGRADEAQAELRTILRDHPYDGDAWLALADLDARFDESDIARMQEGLDRTDSPERSRTALGFALARALEVSKRYDEAWNTLVAANARVRRVEPWNASAMSADVAATLSAFDAKNADERSERGSEIIFIVGLPRSGSTLIEQILATHKDVEGAGELPDLPIVLDAESKRRGTPLSTWAQQATSADWARLGDEYLSRTARWRATRPRSTDKLPSNWRHLGALRRMLPGARVIVCRRDPVENAIACFARLFAPHAQRFSYDLDDIASYWRDFDAAIAFWRARYANNLREQSYEALLADPESEIRALLDFCELDFDPACLAPHETQRVVRTHSAAQVRGPLRGGRARAAYYAHWLGPLKSALNERE